MTRRSAHAHADEQRHVLDRGTAGLGLFEGQSLDPAPASRPDPSIVPIDSATPADVRRVQRTRRVREQHDSAARHWIDLGKPVALQVARADREGRVTAATFRAAAEALGGRLPSVEDQRALSYLPSMFGELVAEGSLRKLRRDDGSVVKVYEPSTGNDVVVYVLAGGASG